MDTGDGDISFSPGGIMTDSAALEDDVPEVRHRGNPRR